MQPSEKDSNVISIEEIDAEEVTPQKKYEAVRFNAQKHGILSKQVVLVHEDAGEFSELLTSLIEEHQPAGITELHLIEELASIMWRKRRVLQAEGAQINRSLHSVINNKLRSPIQAAIPCERSILNKDTDLHELMKSTSDEITQAHYQATIDLNATNKAESILRKGGPNAYKKAQRTLTHGYLGFWRDHIDENEQGNKEAEQIPV